jgi:hypothetical protein
MLAIFFDKGSRGFGVSVTNPFHQFSERVWPLRWVGGHLPTSCSTATKPQAAERRLEEDGTGIKE